MHATLQSNGLSHVQIETVNVSKTTPFVSNRYHFNNYKEQLTVIENRVLRSIDEGKKHFERPFDGNEIDSDREQIGGLQNRKIMMGIPATTIHINRIFLNYAILPGSDINIPDENGVTPLMAAAAIGESIGLISDLIKRGANVNRQDNEGNTALLWVVRSLSVVDRQRNDIQAQKKYRMMDVLIENGANVNLAGTAGFTPLIFSVVVNDYSAFDRLIKKAKIDRKNNAGETALHLAVKYKADQRIFNQLFLSMTDLDMKDNNGQTPFIIAAQVSNMDIMESLLTKNININETDNKDWTALMHAVNNKFYEIANYLINEGADINYENSHNRNALMIAFERGDEKMADVFFNAGAEITDAEKNRRERLSREGQKSVNATEWAVNANGNKKNAEIDSVNNKLRTDPVPSNAGGMSPIMPVSIMNRMEGLYQTVRQIITPRPPV